MSAFPSISLWQRWLEDRLAQPVDGASVAAARIVFGLTMAWEAYRYLRPGPAGSRIDQIFYQAEWNVPFPLSEWLVPWSAPGMYVHCAVVGLAGFALACGWLTRLAALALFISWSSMIGMEATRYNNHYYLAALVALLLAIIPSGRCLSIDSLTRSASRRRGERRNVIPFAGVAVLRAQLLVVYTFGGIAKLNRDYLFDAEPVRSMLAQARLPSALQSALSSQWLASFEHWRNSDLAAFEIAYSGLVFDLTVGWLLLVRRTRTLGFALAVVFHGLNHFVLFDDIGVFPLMALGLTTVFFEPDWPRRLANWLTRPRLAAPDWRWLIVGAVVIPGIGALLGWRQRASGRCSPLSKRPSRFLAPAVAAWCVAQVLLPLRHFAISGDVRWTHEGGLFSWNMKAAQMQAAPLYLRLKCEALAESAQQQSTLGPLPDFVSRSVVFHQVDPQKLDWTVLPSVVVTHEPICGERVFFNPEANSQGGGRSERSIELAWREAFGRRPAIGQTRTFAETLDAIESLLIASSRERTLALVRQVRDAQEGLATNGDDHPTDSNQLRKLLRSLVRLLESARQHDLHEEVMNHLWRVEPFALCGGVPSGRRPQIVNDPALFDKRRGGYTTLNRDGEHSQFPELAVVHVDFSALTFQDWQFLPRACRTIAEDGQVEIVWNASRDLAAFQLPVVLSRPWMIHRYAAEVSRRWHEQTGRQPAVYASAQLGMNGRPLQPLIDASVDLTSQRLYFLRHNHWIVPLAKRTNRPAASGEGVAR